MTAAVARRFACAPEDVFAILADGWLYPAWVVGAARARAVTRDWPAAGARLHHSVGVWPVLIHDATDVIEWSPPRRMRTHARIGLIGRGEVTLEVRPDGSGCLVRIAEAPTGGPAALLPRIVWEPLLHLRNRETMRRLRMLAEGRRREREAGGPTARERVPGLDPLPPGPDGGSA